MLSPRFRQVYGVDLGEEQIKHAKKADNIQYRVGASEDLSFLPNDSVDLITVGTAYHWFKEDQFWKEVMRVLKPGGVVAIFGIKNVRMLRLQQLMSHFC